MDIATIRKQADHQAALARIEALMNSELNTPDGDELDVLTTLVEAHEQKQFGIEAPDPIEFLKNAMAFMGVEQSGLAELLNSR